MRRRADRRDRAICNSYSEQEKQPDPAKRDMGLYLFKGDEGRNGDPDQEREAFEKKVFQPTEATLHSQGPRDVSIG